MAASGMDIGSDALSSVSGSRNLRSCQVCRTRKIKCDRQQPCSNCARADTACVYPSGRGRAPKRPRKVTERYVADRLSRLEAVIRELDTRSHPKGLVAKGRDMDKPETSTALGGGKGQSDTDQSADERFSRLMVREQTSYYVNDNALWGNLADEVEELREMLLDPGSDDEGLNPPTIGSSKSTSSSLGMNAAILGYRSVAHSLHSLHPPLAQAVTLFRVFTENVAPMVRIFHMPTLSRDYWDALASLDSIGKDTEAVLFTVYYTAIISISPQICMEILGMPREQAATQYRFAVEQSLARADLLNTQSTTLLQAATCFVLALRNEDDSRTLWSLATLIYHTAQTMGLHRDGTRFGLKPFETEMRRRLWWHICLLDNRSSEYHGFEPIVNDRTFDTKPPLNINDSDIEPNMSEFPAGREGFTEMTFCLIRVDSMKAAWKLFRKSAASSEPRGHLAEDVLSREQCDTLLKGLEEELQSKYLRHCDPSVPSQLIVYLTPQLILKRLWLMIHAPRITTNDRSKQSQISEPYDAKIRDQLFRTSIEILELAIRLLLDPLLSPWHWHSHTYIQWSAAALVLSELCARPPSADCDRAWECVQKAYDVWKLDKRAQKSTLWRPIRRMMAKARPDSIFFILLPMASLGWQYVEAGSDSTPSSAFTAAQYSQLEDLTFPKDLGVFGEMFGGLFPMDFSEDVFNADMSAMGQF
ncbi:Zn(II)2Cys6 transcription factor [Apiospora saccharicola]